MLVDVSYFTSGARYLLNAGGGQMPSNQSKAVNAFIETYIKDYQEPFLCELLGDDAGKDFNEYLIKRDSDEVEADNDLEVLRLHTCEIFADYVMFFILRDSMSMPTVNGVVLVKSGNELTAPIDKQVLIWNRMVDRVRVFIRWSDGGFQPTKNLRTKINNLGI